VLFVAVTLRDFHRVNGRDYSLLTDLSISNSFLVSVEMQPPLIPEKFIDIPSQRLYYLSLAFLIQAVKALDFVWFLASSDDSLALCKKWLLVDIGYFCIALSWLRIPRLTYTRTVVLLQLVFIILSNGLLFGGISLNFGGTRRDSGTSTQAGALEHSTHNSS
jgi:nucleoporin POM152